MDWKIRAVLSQTGQLDLTIIDEAGTADVDWGPVHYLTAAIAGCFVKSCRMVQDALGQPSNAVEALVIAEKAEAKPSRIGRVTIQYAIAETPPEQAARLAKDAKRICTVTNTLNCEFELVN